MQRKWKITAGILTPIVIAAGVAGGLRWSRRDLVTVQTGVVVKTDLTAIVSASGEIKPRNYINLGANAQGPLTDIFVKEGEHVRKGEVVARIEQVQARAEVLAQRAAVASSLADSAAAEAGLKVQDDSIKTAAATVERFKTELDRAKLNLDRADQLWQQKLIARQEYDQRRSDYDAAAAGLRENQARVVQLQTQSAQIAAQIASAQRRVAQVQAGQTRVDDVLAKHDVVSPIDGVVTNLPVRVGETVVPGVQNSAASTIMTIADMSLITAEVKVDETDIVNVRIGQVATISMDALPNRTFMGKVIEIGNTAILRSSGLAASQSATASQEAKDFKVVIALDDPPEDIRPGLSASAKITTAIRPGVLSVPIQALTVRKRGELVTPPEGVQAASNPITAKAKNEELQGVFVVAKDRAEFREVQTGIAGVSDIEVIGGLQDGDQILTGPYKAIRTIRNGTRIKIDNTNPVADPKN